MKTFRGAARVRVQPGHVLAGRTGVVRRLRRADDGAWVEIDGDPLSGPLLDLVREFPADDPAGRGNHVVLYPDECEALP